MELDFRGLGEQGVFCIGEECKFGRETVADYIFQR